jgi:hypothetical protein
MANHRMPRATGMNSHGQVTQAAMMQRRMMMKRGVSSVGHMVSEYHTVAL